MGLLNEKHHDPFRELIQTEHIYNPWFTEEYVIKAIDGIVRMLQPDVLTRWMEPYAGSLEHAAEPRTVGLVMAGNIPLVGFHDFMSVLITGHRVLAKPSSKDNRLIKSVARVLANIDPAMGGRIRFTDEYLREVDAVIATGSDNTARYFDYYFRDRPHIIRRNRSGVAVLTGNESLEDLKSLGEDIFTFFGLGCRNVTKLYLPDSYDITTLMEALESFGYLYHHHKYGNNVDYYRTIFLMNRIRFFDNGVLLVKEDQNIASPVGVVYYERYSDFGKLHHILASRSGEIQCCVSTDPDLRGAIPPGTSQKPLPWDYADGIDTIRFLTELN